MKRIRSRTKTRRRQGEDDGAHDFGSRKPQQRRQPRNSPSATPVEETLKLARRALNNTEYERVKEFTAHRRRIAASCERDARPPYITRRE